MYKLAIFLLWLFIQLSWNILERKIGNSVYFLFIRIFKLFNNNKNRNKKPFSYPWHNPIIIKSFYFCFLYGDVVHSCSYCRFVCFHCRIQWKISNYNSSKFWNLLHGWIDKCLNFNDYFLMGLLNIKNLLHVILFF